MVMRRVLAVLASATLCAVSGCGGGSGHSSRIDSSSFADRAARAEAANTTTVTPAACSPGDRGPGPGDADAWNRAMDRLTAPSWWTGDVGATAQLSDGRIVWLFGDTTRRAGARPHLVPSSMLISQGRCFAEVEAPGHGALIRGFPDGTVCWPSSVLALPLRGRDALAVACSRIRRGGGQLTGQASLYDFTYQGMSLAIFSVPRGGAPALVNTVNVMPDDDDPEQVNWGAAMATESGWVYLYGSRQPKGSVGKSAYVARAHVAEIGEASAWQFWDGRTFQADADAAQPIVPATQGVSQTFSVVPWHGSFLLVSKLGGDLGAGVGIWRAAHPQGPWSLTTTVPQPYSLGGGTVAYMPLAHPEIPTPGGRLMLSVSRNTQNVKDLSTQPDRGRPMFLQVPVP